MSKLRIRTAYDTDAWEGDSFEDHPSLTVQCERDECDVNLIVDRFEKTGLLPQTNAVAQYGDFSNAPDFREALDIVTDAQKMFDDLPAKLRKQFDNDPAQFLDFASNPDNAEEMLRLGLIEARPSPAPQGDILETANAAPTPSKDGSKSPSE